MSLAAALGVILLTRPASAYRTAQDSQDFAGEGRIAWSEPGIGFWLSRAGLPDGVSETAAESALSQALSAWAEPNCTTVRPYFAGWTSDAAATEDGSNTVSWVSDWKERNWSAAVPGNTDLQYTGTNGDWSIAEADVYLNGADYDWSAEAKTPIDLATVLTHELGHALGLLHPCEPDGSDGAPVCSERDAGEGVATMYPNYDPAQSSLAEDDINGICYLYPIPTDECGGTCGRLEICVDKACHAVCGELVCELGEACGHWGCLPEGACRSKDCTGQACAEDADCGPLARCADGACQSGSTAWGGPCGSSRDCDKAACVGGVCQPTCNADGECGANGTCTTGIEGSVHGCENSGAYRFGMTCGAGDDCSSGLCVFTDAGAACTKACTSSASCPARWSCKTVDEREVCVADAVNLDGGCTFSGEQDSGSGWELVGLIIPLAAVTRRRRKSPGSGK